MKMLKLKEKQWVIMGGEYGCDLCGSQKKHGITGPTLRARLLVRRCYFLSNVACCRGMEWRFDFANQVPVFQRNWPVEVNGMD